MTMPPPSKYADKWCRDCGWHNARHQDGYLCPCCQDHEVKATQAEARARGWRVA